MGASILGFYQVVAAFRGMGTVLAKEQSHFHAGCMHLEAGLPEPHIVASAVFAKRLWADNVLKFGGHDGIQVAACVSNRYVACCMFREACILHV